MVAKFRIDYGRANGDPAFETLVAALRKHSPEFRRWWPLQNVSNRAEGVKRFRHETLGDIELEHTSFLVEGAPDLRMVIYTPLSKQADTMLAERELRSIS
jgi:MmyB-like transcription regulator ligand binding domain